MIDDKTLDKIENDNSVDYPRPCIDEKLALSFHDFLYEKKDVINQLTQALRNERSQSSQDKAMIEDLVYRLDKEREETRKWKDQAFLEIKAGNAGRELILELHANKKVLREACEFYANGNADLPSDRIQTGVSGMSGNKARAALEKVK